MALAVTAGWFACPSLGYRRGHERVFCLCHLCRPGARCILELGVLMIEEHLRVLKGLALNATSSGRNIYCYWCYKNLFRRFRDRLPDIFGNTNSNLLLSLDNYFKISIFSNQPQRTPKIYLDALPEITSDFDPEGEAEEEYAMDGCIELLEAVIILINQISFDNADNVVTSALKMLNVIDIGSQLVPDRIGDYHIDLVVQKQQDAVVFMTSKMREDDISVFEFP